MRVLLFLTLVLLSGPVGAQSALRSGGLERCAPTGAGAICRSIGLGDIRVIAPGLVLARNVTISPDYAASGRPVIVELAAMASSEIRWNGVVVARNGRVGNSPAAERPGRYRFSTTIPARLIRAGDNRLTARLSSEHLRLPVRYPVHVFDATVYRAARTIPYLPALLAMGALAIAGLYFAGVAMLRREREPLLLSLIALTSLCQLGLEITRVFMAYAYPWHLPRVAGIAVLAAVTAMLAADYAVTRFAPRRRASVLAAAAATLAAILVFAPAFDPKAAGALLIGGLVLLGGGIVGIRSRVAGARRTVAAAALFILLLLVGRDLFLDNIYYLALAVLFAALVVGQVWELRRIHAAHALALNHAALLAGELRALREDNESGVIAIKDGTRSHIVDRTAISRVRAEDDYCEVTTTDGRTLLATMTLAKLHAALPPQFRRVHKSFVVNEAEVASLVRRPGGGRQLLMKDGVAVPVGRAYSAAVTDWSS